MKVEPYLHFGGRCEEAIEFYKQAVGAEVTVKMRFKDCPDKSMIQPGVEEKIMHANMRIGDSTVMISDGRCQGSAAFEGFSLTVTVKNDAEAEKAFKALSDGVAVTMPLAKTFFSSKFGMLKDRFGVSWTLLVG